MPTRSGTLLLLCVILGWLAAVEGNYGAGQLKLADLLPENARLYDKMRPPCKYGKPTKVDFHVTVMGIDSINENSMTYAADIFFAQSWKDDRLRLPENMTSEYRLLEVEWLNEMWRPDSYFKNAKQVTFQTMTIPNHYVWLYNSKMILYMVKLTLTLSCAMNYAIYPHDTQECKLQIESFSHTTEDLIFGWNKDIPLVVDEHIELPQFDIVKNTTDDCTQVYSTGNFTCLEVVFTLKRRLGHYLFHTYMPNCLIVIMSWISFWIKPEAAAARVTLGVTSLLTLSIQHAKSQGSLPPVSYIKIIDMFMNTCTIFVFLALMEYALVNVVLGDGLDASPVLLKKALPPAATTCVGKKAAPPPVRDPAEGAVPTRATAAVAQGGTGHHLLSENGRLVYLAKQFRLSRSSSSVHYDSATTQPSPKMSQCNSSDNSASHPEIPVTTFSQSRGYHSPHTTPRLTYKCGHQVTNSYSTTSQPRHSSTSDGLTSPHGEGSSSLLYPHLPDCEAAYLQTLTSQHHQGRPPHKSRGSEFREASPSGGNVAAVLDDNELNVRLEADIRNIVESTGQGGRAELPRTVPPPPPPPMTQQQQQTAAAAANIKKLRAKAIIVDRFSRVFFPLTFGLINLIYWVAFWSYL